MWSARYRTASEMRATRSSVAAAAARRSTYGPVTLRHALGLEPTQPAAQKPPQSMMTGRPLRTRQFSW
jgi:hypothetical protein